MTADDLVARIDALLVCDDQQLVERIRGALRAEAETVRPAEGLGKIRDRLRTLFPTRFDRALRPLTAAGLLTDNTKAPAVAPAEARTTTPTRKDQGL